MDHSLILGLSILLIGCPIPLNGLGSLPDASQEGLLRQYSGYNSLTIFRYTVPAEVTRATWEFAAFQDLQDCPSREAKVFIQHGSFPVFPDADNSSFPSFFYLDRTNLDNASLTSAYRPDSSTVFHVEKPLPGTWFAAAYLSPFVKKHGLLASCRYSLGSIALWSRAENVRLLLPSENGRTYTTDRPFSYFKFSVSDDVDAFEIVIDNCKIRLRNRKFENCLEFVGVRANALPTERFLEQNSFYSLNMTSEDKAAFFEDRPVKASGGEGTVVYYVLVISQARVSFNVKLRLFDCGETGLYGQSQSDWVLSEKGLIYVTEDQPEGQQRSKEPETGFQLFRLSNAALEDTSKNKIFDEDPSMEDEENENREFNLMKNLTEKRRSKAEVCPSTFDFNRIENVNEFSVNYLLQGRSWYTKWLTVLESRPLVTRFKTLDYLDIGGFLTLKLRMDEDNRNMYRFQRITGCLSKGRRPDVNSDTECDASRTVVISNQNGTSLQGMKVVPYPEPGVWYLSFKLTCHDYERPYHLAFNETEDEEEDEPSYLNYTAVECPKSLKSTMVSVEMYLQPCDYRQLHNICGSYGVCAKTTKGYYRLSACTCSQGRKGLTCDDESISHPEWKSKLDTLLLTLSNFAFLPAIILALYYRLFTEALIYTATMCFSTFYHTCDREALTSTLPYLMEKACMSLYVNREVLQFCDYYCATLSFWITIISLAKLPPDLVNFLNVSGVLLVAVLVQYNRTAISVFVIPIPLGILVLIVSLVYKSLDRRRAFRPNRACLSLFTPAIVCSAGALILFGLFETNLNYPYVHSTWHVLIAFSLVFLLPRCVRRKSKSSGAAAEVKDDQMTIDRSSVIPTSEIRMSELSPSPSMSTASTNSNEEDSSSQTAATSTAEDDEEEEDSNQSDIHAVENGTNNRIPR